MPRSLNGQTMELVPLVRELNRLAGEHGVGRGDVVEDRLFGIKTRELYEAPAATVLRSALRDLESLVQSRELRLTKDSLGRRYAELVYAGHWFHDLRERYRRSSCGRNSTSAARSVCVCSREAVRSSVGAVRSACTTVPWRASRMRSGSTPAGPRR